MQLVLRLVLIAALFEHIHALPLQAPAGSLDSSTTRVRLALANPASRDLAAFSSAIHSENFVTNSGSASAQPEGSKPTPEGESLEGDGALTLDALLVNVDEEYPGLAGLVASLESRSRLSLLHAWLEARARRGSVDSTVHRALAMLSRPARLVLGDGVTGRQSFLAKVAS